MVAAKPFHGENAPAAEKLRGYADTLLCCRRRFFALLQIIAGPASRTRYRLSIETAVLRVVILCGAVIVEAQISHCRIDPVVRQAQNDRVARAAIRTVDIRIAVAPIGRIEQFLQARVANRKVRSNADGETVSPMAFANCEFVQSNRVGTMDFNFRDVRSGRRFRFQILHKCQQAFLRAFEKNLDSLLAIQDPTCKRVGACKPIYEWPKTNPLHHAANSNGAGPRHSFSPSTKQLRPCQPIWITLPSSTSTGTARCPVASSRMRWHAAASASTSYSTKSLRFHSS